MKKQDKALELYKQAMVFREHCLEVAGKPEYAIVSKEELDSYNTILDTYSKKLKDPHLDVYTFKDSHLRVSSSSGYVFLPPQSILPKVQFLLEYLKTKYRVPSVIEINNLRDGVLRDRLLDLVALDRPIDTITREVTTVVEDRIRKLSGKSQGSPEELLSPGSRESAWLEMDPDMKGSLYYLAKSFFTRPRNASHHSLSDDKEKKNVLPYIYIADEILFNLPKLN